MTIGFYTVFRKDPRHFLMARRMLMSSKEFMDVPIVQFSDDKTPTVPGVDIVETLPRGKMLERRLEHYSKVTKEDWLFVDPITCSVPRLVPSIN